MLYYMYQKLVNVKLARSLESYSLSYEKLAKWMEGMDRTLEVVPLGYAGNPKGYEAVSRIAKEVLEVQVNAVCENMFK